MASTDSESGLYRTTSASTASSSLNGHAHYTTSATSLSAAHPGQAQHDSREAAATAIADAGDGPKRKRKRRRAKLKNKASTSTGMPPTPAVQILKRPSASSSIVPQSMSPAKSVATSADTKGKGKARDVDYEEDTGIAVGGELLNRDVVAAPSSLVNDPFVGQTEEASKYSVEPPLPSPAESGTSSTDELSYGASATASPQVTPQAKRTPTTQSSAHHASPLAAATSSPFKAPLTRFNILPARDSAVSVPPAPIFLVDQVSTEGLGIAGKGLENMPAKEVQDVKEASISLIEAAKQVKSVSSDGGGKKKVAASPLTWSTSHHKAIDAPTLGSPTLGSLSTFQDEDEALASAITKASFSAGQTAILQELANRKALKKQAELESQQADADRARAVQDRPAAGPEEQHTVTAPEPSIPSIETVPVMPSRQDLDGVKRRDMAAPVIAPEWQVLLSPTQNQANLPENGSPVQMASSVERSPLLGNGATSGTADVEEDFDDGASDASQTSFLIRGVARDSDLSRGWEDLDTGSNAKEKARKRLQEAIYELNKRHRPSHAVKLARQEMLTNIRRRLNWLLKEEYAPNFQYQLKPFGSTAYGLDTDSSDLDLCIIDPRRPDGFRNAADLYDLDSLRNGREDAIQSTEEDEDNRNTTPMQRFRKGQRWAETSGKKPLVLDEIYNIGRLANLLRKMGYEQVVAIPGAIVPIVKFKSSQGIKADMNPNEQLGVRNSALLAQYVAFKPIIRPFLIFIKVWAKQRRINDPSGRRGPMSLSSYSLVLMAVAYLQHAGVLPNLQDPQLIAKHGAERHTFWTKVPNPDISRGRQRAKQKYLGDYKAMAVDTTFVSADMIRSQNDDGPSQQTVEGKKARRNSHSRSPRRQAGSLGWDSDTASDTATLSDSAQEKSDDLLKLVEGFFEYYLGFPVEDKAISIWKGKPIDRVHVIPKHPGARHMQSSRKIRRQTREVQEESRELEDEQSLADVFINTANGRSASSDSDTVTGSDETVITEDEELAAMHAKLTAQLEKLGIKESGASFEETHKMSKTQMRKQRRKERQLMEKQAQAPAPAQPAMQGIDAMEQIEEAEETDEAGLSTPTYKGLDVSEANPKTGLFPVPAVEKPENFVEPPTWIQQLVVQDPFIHTRNTTMNILPETVNVIWHELQRALDMIKAGKSLDQICQNKRHESTYEDKPRFKPNISLDERKLARSAKKKAMREQKPRNRTLRRAAERLQNGEKGQGGDQ